jgi:uroporphyrinogen decarboxylase
MNGLERVKAAINHTPPDTIPVGAFVGSMAAKFAGIKISRYVTDGAAIAEAQYKLWQETGSDVVITAADAYYLAEAFGMKTEIHEDRLPTAERPPLENLMDALNLEPADPYRAGRMIVYIQAVEELAKKLKGQVAIRSTGTGPFSIAGYLLGLDNFLMKLAEIDSGETEDWEEKALNHIMNIAAETLISFMIAQVKAGADIAYIGDSLASPNVVSPATYRKYAFPYHKKIIDAVRPILNEYDASIVLHICGNTAAILKDFTATGIDLLDIDSVLDLAMVKNEIGDRVCSWGNINPVFLEKASPSEIEEEAKRCINAAAAFEGGFILGTGCFISDNTPVRNLAAMSKAAHSAG